MNILVFGGSGFLGSYLIDEIISRGYSVVNADIRPPKYNIERQKYLFVDILNLEEVFKTVDSSFDCVYNLAGMSDLNESVNGLKETYELNIIGHINILEACILIKSNIIFILAQHMFIPFKALIMEFQNLQVKR